MSHILVDLDGTLAKHAGTSFGDEIGEPIPKMLEQVLQWLDEGKDVRIFTARMSLPDLPSRHWQERLIGDWCEMHLGRRLVATATKDLNCEAIYDDIAHHVIQNKGIISEEKK